MEITQDVTFRHITVYSDIDDDLTEADARQAVRTLLKAAGEANGEWTMVGCERVNYNKVTVVLELGEVV